MNKLPKRAKRTRRNFRRDVCIALLCLAGFVSAPQTPAQIVRAQVQSPATSSDAKTYTLKGTVVNALTGEPINRALVQVPNAHSVMTASDGSFEVTGIPDVVTFLTARKPGFFNDPEIHPGRQFLYINVAEVKDPQILKLTPQGIISGRVTDSAGDPIEYLSVGLVSSSIQDGRKRLVQSGQTTTNENGEYRLPQLRPGQYFLFMGPAVAATSGQPGPKAGARGYAKTYLPGVPDRAEAAPITIAPGQRSEMNLVLEAVPLYKVSGRVVGVPPNAGPVLQVSNPDGDDVSPVSNFYNLATGDFRLSLPRGAFTIKAFTQIFAIGQEQRLEAQAGVNVVSDVDNVILGLAPAASAPIEIRVESTKPDSPFSSPNFHPNVYIRAFPDAPLRADQSSQPESPQDPSLVLKNLEPGKYWVQVENANPGYVQSMRSGSQDLTREALTVSAGQRLPPIEIVLRDDSATLAVSLRSENPNTMATVVVAGSGSLQNSLKIFQCPGNGSSGVNGLAPGEYTAYAFDNVADLEYRNPDVLSAYSSHAAHVTLAPNGKTNVTLDLIHVED